MTLHPIPSELPSLRENFFSFFISVRVAVRARSLVTTHVNISRQPPYSLTRPVLISVAGLLPNFGLIEPRSTFLHNLVQQVHARQIYHTQGRSLVMAGGDHRGAFCRGVTGTSITHRAAA
jgi:hypothetical protein